MNKYFYLAAAFITMSLVACSDDEVSSDTPGGGESTELPDWYYTGGELGTTFNTSASAFEDPTPAVENAGADLIERTGSAIIPLGTCF